MGGRFVKTVFFSPFHLDSPSYCSDSLVETRFCHRFHSPTAKAIKSTTITRENIFQKLSG